MVGMRNSDERMSFVCVLHHLLVYDVAFGFSNQNFYGDDGCEVRDWMLQETYLF